MNKYIEDITPYLDIIDNSILLFKDGRMAMLYKIRPVAYDFLDDTELQAIHENIASILKRCPQDIHIQKFDIFYSNYSNLTIQTNNNIILEKLSNQIKKQKHIYDSQYISFVYTPYTNLKNPTNSNLSINPKVKNIKKALQKKEYFINEVETLVNNFGITTVSFTILNAKEINELIYQFYNCEFDKTHDYIQNNFAILKNSLEIGNKKIRIFSFDGQAEMLSLYSEKKYTDKTNMPQFYMFPTGVDLQIPHIRVTNFKHIDRKKIDTIFQIEKLIGESNYTQLDSIFSRASDVKETLKFIYDEGDSVCSLNIQFILFEEDTNKLNRNIKLLQNKINELKFYFIQETLDTSNLYLCNSPANTDNYRDIFIPVSCFPIYFDFTTSYYSDREGDLYTDRYGKPIFFDTFHKDLTMQNSVTIGPTGSGKSFQNGYAIVSSHLRGEVNVIIDKGATTKNLVEALGGAFIIWTKESEQKFNPFIISKNSNGNYLLDDDEKLFFLSLIGYLYKGNEPFTQEEVSIFDNLIENYYVFINKNRSIPSLKSYIKFCKEYLSGSIKNENFYEFIGEKDLINKFFDINHFELCLLKYTDGMYKDIFSDKEEVLLIDHKLIAFETDNLSNDDVLSPLMTMLNIKTILDVIKRYPKLKKHMTIEEAWNKFEGQMRYFMEYLYRCMRKLLGDVKIITQNAMDVEKSGLKHIIEANSGIFYFLNHKGKNVDDLKKIFNLTDREVMLVNSLRKENNDLNIGREFFVKRIGCDPYGLNANDTRVLSLKIPKSIHAILTSNPQEREWFNEKKKELKNIEKAMIEFEENY